MSPTIEDHAARFDSMATDYDHQNRPVYSACAALVIEAADTRTDDVVLDLGTGTGAIALALADTANLVVGRDVSSGMLTEARKKAEACGVRNVDFGKGRFRDPQFDGAVDIVTTNYALHHLDNDAKREAISKVRAYNPRRFVLGDLMLFDGYPSTALAFDPAVDDPATVDALEAMLTDAGFVITEVVPVTDQAGVIVAEDWAD